MTLLPTQREQSPNPPRRNGASPGLNAADRLAEQLGIELRAQPADRNTQVGPICRHRPVHDLTHLQLNPGVR